MSYIRTAPSYGIRIIIYFTVLLLCFVTVFLFMLLCNRSRFMLLVVQLLNHLCFIHSCASQLYVIFHSKNRSAVCFIILYKLFILLLSDLLSLFNYNLILNFYQNYRLAFCSIKTIT